MAKDRARPFSRKHRKYWIPITGGMILIGVANLALGFCSYDPPTGEFHRIDLGLPKHDAGVAPAPPDAPDAAAVTPPARTGAGPAPATAPSAPTPARPAAAP